MIEKGLLHAVEEMSLERGCADGTRRFLISDENKRAVRALLQRHLRNNGNAQPRAYHSQYAAELATFKNYLWQHAGALTDFNRRLAKTVIIPQQQERLITQLFHHQSPFLRQPVPFGKYGVKA